MQAVQQTWDAADYAANSAVQAGWGRELIGRLALRGDEQVLDIGCGDGRLTAQLAARLPAGAVLGIDASAAMQALATERWGDGVRLTFRQMDAQAIHAAADLARRFDVVFSTSALHWVADHPAVLTGVRRSLRRGGRLWLQTAAVGNCAAVLTAAEQVCAAPRWRDRFAGFSHPWRFCAQSDYARWLPQAGLRPDRLAIVRRSVWHAGAEALSGWLRTTWLPYLTRLPAAERADFVAALVAAYLHHVPTDAAGRIPVEMVRLEVVATLANE